MTTTKDTNAIAESSNKRDMTDKTVNHIEKNNFTISPDHEEDLKDAISKITFYCVIILVILSCLYYYKYLSFGLSGIFYFWVIPY